MPREPSQPKQVWQDSKGKVHNDKEAAYKAEKRYVVEQLLQPITKSRDAVDAFELRRVNLDEIRGYNPETLQPIVDYFNEMLAEALKRQGRSPS